MSAATAADEFKLKFFEGARDLMAADPATREVAVTYGAPGSLDPEDIVSFLDVRSDQSAATIGQRARDEDLEITVAISCFRGGLEDMELVCARRAYQLLRMLDYYVRKTDTTLGGTVLWCFSLGHESAGQTDPQLISQGRVIEITARFLAKARIT